MSDDLHALTGAYAANALSEHEQAAVARHLFRCAPCRAEVAELQATAARLGGAVAEAPPAGLKERALAAAATSRQIPPAADGGRRAGRWSTIGPRLLVAAAVIALTAGLSLAGLNAGLKSRLDASRRTSDQVTEVLTASDVRLRTVRNADGVAATIALSPAQGLAAFLATGLPRVTASRTYELWLVGADGTRPAGLISASTSGPVATVLSGRAAAGDRIALTVEPGGGSSQPTGPPVVLVDLPS